MLFMKTVTLIMVNIVAQVCLAGIHEVDNIRMLGRQTTWTYTMFSPSLYLFYEGKGGPTYLASKNVEYRVYDIEENDGKTYYLVKEEILLPTTRQSNSTKGYQGIHLALREEGGKVIVDHDDYKQFIELNEQDFKAGDPSYIPYRKTDSGELLLYDFTLQKGDKYVEEMDGHPEIFVLEVDSIKNGEGRECRRLTLSNGCIIIEGIGCINSRGMLLSYLNPGEVTDDYIFWLSWKSDEYGVVYQNYVDESTLGLVYDRSGLPSISKDTTFYTIGGVRIAHPIRGINIKRQSDGTTRKVIMR